MKNTEAVAIAETLAGQQWQWSRKSLRATLRKLGWKKTVSNEIRDSYRVNESLEASAYFEDDETCLGLEVDLEVFVDADTLFGEEYDEKEAEFDALFEAAQGAIAKKLGKPAFSGSPSKKKFPGDQDANLLALWNYPSARLMLQKKHEDRELPFRITLVAAPPT